MILRFAQTASLLLLVIFTAVPVHAATSLNGMALHVQLGEEQFIAALYAETLSSDPKELLLKDEDKAMELRILADNVYARRFQRMWIEGIAINAGTAEMEKNAQHLATFSNSLKIKMIQGDILRIERINAEKATKVSLNGQNLAVIPDAHFFDLLLRTWLGPVPLSSQFKESLLAAGNVDSQLAARFANVSPAPPRVAEIAAVLQQKTPQETPPKPDSAPPVAATTSPPPINAGNPTDPGSTTPAANNPSQTGENAVAVTTPAEPEPKPEPEELATEASLFGEDTIFDDEEKEAYSFTAENLLSEQIYIAKLTKWTSNFVTYPRGALRNQQQGTVRLTVTLARDGRVKDVQILEKSEHDTLNKAATRAVKSASPYPAVPDAISGEQFLFTVPVVFRLN